MSYKIGSFNCLNLGIAASKDIQKFADIILDEQFDIIALQEIKGQNGLNRILSCLDISRTHWDGIADDEVNDYAFIWNTRRFEIAKTKVLDKFGRIVTRKYQPRIYKQYRVDRKHGQTDLIREPFFARFYPCGGGGNNFELRLINTHIRFSKGNDPESNLPGATQMRKNELEILAKAIYAKEADKQYGDNRPAYTILLGDYNLNLPFSVAKYPYLQEKYVIDEGNSSKIIATVQHELTTLPRISDSDEDIEETTHDFVNNYDHFTYDINRFSGVTMMCGRINTVEKYCKGDYDKHRKDISDHIPIEMKFDLKSNLE